MSKNDIHLDFDREERVGFPEIVYGLGKSTDQLLRILEQYREKEKPVLITRLDAEKAAALQVDDAENAYDPVSQTLLVGEIEAQLEGLVGIISAGTSDAPVVGEAARTLAYLGVKSESVQDVGVAGIHRLLNQIDEFDRFNVVICVAGFEGALASVLGGLLWQPIIAVPTSVGYGAANGGQTALHAMLTSCANGILVVNIDNGCGAAMAAVRMLNGMQNGMLDGHT